MAIIRACSYNAKIRTPQAPDQYSEFLAVFQQKQQNIVTKTSVTTDSQYVYVSLSQEETKLFKEGIPAYLQLRCYASTYDAPGSALFKIDVWNALDDRILGGT